MTLSSRSRLYSLGRARLIGWVDATEHKLSWRQIVPSAQPVRTTSPMLALSAVTAQRRRGNAPEPAGRAISNGVFLIRSPHISSADGRGPFAATVTVRGATTRSDDALGLSTPPGQRLTIAQT